MELRDGGVGGAVGVGLASSGVVVRVVRGGVGGCVCGGRGAGALRGARRCVERRPWSVAGRRRVTGARRWVVERALSDGWECHRTAQSSPRRGGVEACDGR